MLFVKLHIMIGVTNIINTQQQTLFLLFLIFDRITSQEGFFYEQQQRENSHPFAL